MATGDRLLSRRHLVPAAVLLVLLAVPFRGLWTNPGPPMEEGFMLVFPERLLEGDVPNRDFLHLYGPGSLWVLAAAFAVLGVRLWVERAVGALQIVGLVAAVYAVLRPWGRSVATTGAAVSLLVILTPTGFTALAWVGGIALGAWAVHHGLEAVEGPEARRRRHLWCAGLLVGAALLYRLDLVVAMGLSMGLVLWRLAPADRRRLLLAAVVGVSPYLVHLVMAGPRPVVEGMLLEPVFELRGGRALPLPPSGSGFDGFLQRAWMLPDVKPPYPLPAPSSPVQMQLWLGLLLVASAVLVVAGVRAARAGRYRLLVLAAFAVGLLPQALQRADSTHLAWVSCVTLGLLPAAVADLLDGRPARVRTALGVAVVPVLLLVAAPHFTYRSYGEAVAQTFGERVRSHEMRNGDRVFLYGRADAAAAVNELVPLVESLTQPGDRLFVGPVDLRKTPYSEAYLYHLLPDLDPATRYIEMDPGVANAEGSGLADELAGADVAVLTSIQSEWEEPNDSRLFGPEEPNEVLAEQFELVASYGDGPDGRGLFEVWVHR